MSSWADTNLEAGGEFLTLDDLVRAADALFGRAYPEEDELQIRDLSVVAEAEGPRQL